MRVSFLVLAVAFWPSAAISQTSSPAQTPESAKKQETKPAPSKRVRANLSGFELDKAPAQQPATQIGGAARGSDQQVVLLAPRIGKTYRLRPVFRWEVPNQATSFRFRLMNEAGEPIYEQSLQGKSLRYPENAPALKPGQTYIWTIAPDTSLMGVAATPAKLVVVDATERTQIERELSAAISPRARAQVFVDHRLWFDAVQALDELITVDSRDASLYQLRSEVFAQTPATDAQARADEERAVSLEDPH